MWQWHAIEEIEHKAVAFDVYKYAKGSYWLRVQSMLENGGWFAYLLSKNILYILKKEKKLYSLKTWWEALVFLLGKPGILRKTILPYLNYFRPNFHPLATQQPPTSTEME